MSKDIRAAGAEGAEVLESSPGRVPPDPVGQSQKGIFDHLAEYLLQKPLPVPQAASPAARPSESPAGSDERAASQEPISPEPREQPAVEKEIVVREEAVLSAPVEDHVEQIEGGVKPTEAEVEPISPQAARQIDRESAFEVTPPRSVSPAQPVPAGKRQAARTSSSSNAWWAWFTLILIAAVLVAFAVGQFLGSAA